EIVQECGVGLVRVRRDETGFAFAAPPLLRSGPLEDDLVDRLVDFTGVDPKAVVAGEWVDNGPGWMALMLDSADAVKAVRPDFSRWKGGLDLGLVGPYPEGSECQFEVRALFTDDQGMVREDPVTGSLNASLGQWLFAAGYAEGSYLASQGTSMGRRGRVRVSRDGDDVWVGGATRTVIIGQIEF